MKNNISILPVFLFVLIACSNSENQEINKLNRIVGTWQLTEIGLGDGRSSSSGTVIENGYKYTFNENGTFSSNRFDQCSEGSYSVSSNHLILDYNCKDFSTGIENPPGTFIEIFAFSEGFMFLSPTYMNCDEGCYNKFKKI